MPTPSRRKASRSLLGDGKKLDYLYGDRRITIEDLKDFQAVVAGADVTGDPNVVRVFTSNAQFAKWIGDTEHGVKVRRALQIVKTDVPKAREDEAWLRQVQTLALKNARSTFQAFAKTLERDPRDEEVIRRAMVDRTAFTPKVFDPVLLYDRRIEREPPTGAPEDPRTSWLPVWSGAWPDLGWVGWNNRARSVRIFGLNVLCDGQWFGGQWIWLVGFNGLMNLHNLNFEAKASSAISL